MVKFGYTILYVQDVRASVEFYEKAFGFSRKFITPEEDYAELNTGNTALAFVSKSQGNTNLKGGFIESSKENKPFGIEIALIADDVTEVINNAVKNGASLAEKPVTKPWGQTVGYVRDLDGFLIEICSPIHEGE